MSEHDCRLHDEAIADRNSRLLYEIKGDLGEVKGKVGGIERALDGLSDRIEKHFSDDDRRFGALESARSQSLGADEARRRDESRQAGFIAVGVSTVVSMIGWVVNWLVFRH